MQSLLASLSSLSDEYVLTFRLRLRCNCSGESGYSRLTRCLALNSERGAPCAREPLPCCAGRRTTGATQEARAVVRVWRDDEIDPGRLLGLVRGGPQGLRRRLVCIYLTGFLKAEGPCLM